MNLIIPENYDPVLSLRQTQEAIKYIRDTFQKEFGRALMLERISAPLFVQKSSGLNDNLNGVEKPVSFQINCFENDDIEVVHSLAKWKRLALTTKETLDVKASIPKRQFIGESRELNQKIENLIETNITNILNK